MKGGSVRLTSCNHVMICPLASCENALMNDFLEWVWVMPVSSQRVICLNPKGVSEVLFRAAAFLNFSTCYVLDFPVGVPLQIHHTASHPAPISKGVNNPSSTFSHLPGISCWLSSTSSFFYLAPAAYALPLLCSAQYD